MVLAKGFVMKKLLTALMVLALIMMSSNVMASDMKIQWQKRPDFSSLDLGSDGHCYDIDMAYFNNCGRYGDVNIQTLLKVDEKGRIYNVSGVDTGDKYFDKQVVRILKKARVKPFLSQDGVAVKVDVSLPLRLHIVSPVERVGVGHIGLLRAICHASFGSCNEQELEIALQKKSVELRNDCQGGLEYCEILDLWLQKQGL